MFLNQATHTVGLIDGTTAASSEVTLLTALFVVAILAVLAILDRLSRSKVRTNS